MKTVHESVAPQTGVETTGHPGAHWERILVPVDFTPASIAALKHAAKFALRDGSSLCLLHVADEVTGCLDPNLFYSSDDMLHQAERKLARLARLIVPAEVSLRVLVYRGRAVEQIVASAAALRCDAIILGPHKRPRWQRFLGRSTARQIAERANCHVLLMHTPHARRLEPSYWFALDPDSNHGG
jgi:nucleotide-binding universal stress UspA family protein